MKPLIKVMLILAVIFASTFILGRVLGILTVDNVRSWLEIAQNVDPIWIIITVIALLFLDLFVAVPTLTITILAGFFLGFPLGFAAAFVGMTSAAFSGYAISSRWGEKAIAFLVKDPNEWERLVDAFSKSGPAMIMLSRALPILPEVTACMAGATRMAIAKYALCFAISTMPYVAIAAYAGSISSPESPQPAIFAALGLYLVLWIGWFLFKRKSAVRLNV